jgi:serine/threonine protein kinase
MNDIKPVDASTSREEELSFVVYKRFNRELGESEGVEGMEPMTFTFEVRDGVPIKVGDGTFSVVFRVLDTRRVPHALKVLYEGLGDLAQERFNMESNAVERIRSNLRGEAGGRSSFQNVLLPVGSTRSLKQSPGYRRLEEQAAFKKLDVRLSNFAMVSELFDGTLKELLENPPMTEAGGEEPGAGLTGYEILQQLPFSTRIQTCRPFWDQVGAGLLELHRARCVHLDLKPANIYYRRPASPVLPVSVVIGDLGFIGQPALATTGSVGETRAPGTRHYRSPEQKDYFDICEGQILPGEKEQKGQFTYTVVVRDPRFRDTIIEKGDYLRFFKKIEKENTGVAKAPDCLIAEMKWNKGVADITIISEKPIEPDDRTQIQLYKQQRTRTDLFGFGALIYDMITGGRSPERFYNVLGAEDIPERTVSELKEEYIRVKNFSEKDPKYVSGFKDFRYGDTNEYAPEEIVELILQCMLYRSSGTLYDIGMQSSSASWHKAMEMAVEALNVLKDKYPVLNVEKENYLMIDKPKERFSTSPKSFREELQTIQALSGREMLKKRVYEATRWFAILVDLVSRETQGGRRYFFAQLTPENFTRSDKVLVDDVWVQEGSVGLKFVQRAYDGRDGREKYEQDVLADDVYKKVMYDPGDVFSPAEALGYMKLLLQLYPVADQPEQGRVEWEYRFVTASALGDMIHPGDWIVAPKKVAGEVVEADWHHVWFKEGTKMEPGRYVCYRNLDPVSYFLSVLGVYIYQLFFVGLDGNTVSEPSSIAGLRWQTRTNPELLPSLRTIMRKAALKKSSREGESAEEGMASVYRRLTALYVLSQLPAASVYFSSADESSQFGGEVGRTGGESSAQAEPLHRFYEYWDGLRVDIASCLGIPAGYLSGGFAQVAEYGGVFAQGISIEANITNIMRNIMLSRSERSPVDRWKDITTRYASELHRKTDKLRLQLQTGAGRRHRVDVPQPKGESEADQDGKNMGSH